MPATVRRVFQPKMIGMASPLLRAGAWGPAPGLAEVPMKAGGELRFAFCDVFTFRDDLICRVESYVVPLTGPQLSQLADEGAGSAG